MDPKLISIRGLIAKILGKDISADKPVSLTDAEVQQVDTKTKQEGLAAKFMNEHNASLEQEDANAQIAAFMEAQGIRPTVDKEASTSPPLSEGKETPKDTEANTANVIPDFLAYVAKATAERDEYKTQVETLSAQTEPDVPIAIVGASKNKSMKVITPHSATALHGSQAPYRQVENRPWNANAIAADNTGSLKGIKATTWNSITIDKINEDFGSYSRQNSDRMVDIFRDGLMIPSNWQVITNVSDQLTYAQILTGEITQGRKKNWKPKNKVEFVPVIGKVFDIQIDMTWTGAELQALEKTWLKTRLLDNNGSNPYKLDFVMFLWNKFREKARYEDKLGLIKGVYFPNDSLENPGKAINAQSGLLKLINSKKGIEFNPFDLSEFGEPTKANILDYHNRMCELIPDAYKNLELEFGISPSWVRSVKDALRVRDGGNTDYNGPLEHVVGFDNIKYQSISQFEGSNFFYITTPDNMGILVDKLGEEDSMTMELDKRDVNGFVDYKIGAHVFAFGAEMGKNGASVSGYGNQIFWSNDVELLNDVYVPVEANNATPSLKYHNALVIGEENTSKTDITNFIDTPASGTKVYLKGNNDTNPSTVKNNEAIILSGGDCVLTSSTLLVLLVRSDGKFLELYRNDISASLDETVIAVDATTADAGNGKTFVTSANTKETALTNIENATQDVTYRITGGSIENSTTIANGGNFILSAAFTAGLGSYIDLYYNGEKFYEVARG